MNRPIILLLSLMLVACSDGNNAIQFEQPMPDFTMADAWLEDFVATEEMFPGGSMIIVDKNRGVIHKVAFGNQNEDSVVLLASTSKVPTVTLLMALHEDDANVDFDIAAPIANYLPWLGVWDPEITTEHLVSNRSGIPGLLNLFTGLPTTHPICASTRLWAPCWSARNSCTQRRCQLCPVRPPILLLTTAEASGSWQVVWPKW